MKARRGEEFSLEPRKINVYSLELLEWTPPEVVIDVHCSSGTYVRSLANDLGQKLGSGAHLVGLRRTRSGQFTLKDAVHYEGCKSRSLARLVQVFNSRCRGLSDWPAVGVDADR
jgi:tRNA pseudouridine55 synthase